MLTTVEIAGIQEAKETGRLISFCHPLVLDRVQVRAALDEDGAEVRSEVVYIGRPGVEMETLTAVSMALLTVYDYCKAVDRMMSLEGIQPTEKVRENL